MIPRVAFATLTLLCSASLAQPPGVVPPAGGYPNRVRSTTWNGIAESVPANDAEKWHICIASNGNSESQSLIRDFGSNSSLRKLQDWGAFVVIDLTTEIGKARAASLKMPLDKIPCLEIYPPAGSKKFPYKLVFGQHGYDGNADKLYADIHAKIQNKLAEWAPQGKAYVNGSLVESGYALIGKGPTGSRVTIRQCPDGPDDFPDMPDVPTPTPQPQPTPVPPGPLPDPDDPDIPTPTPVQPNPVDPPTPPNPVTPVQPGQFPQYPCVTVIYDPRGIGEPQMQKWMCQLAEAMAAQWQGWTSAKGQALPLGDPRAAAFPVGPGDTPSLWWTNAGRVQGSMSRSTTQVMLRAFAGAQGQAAPGATTPQINPSTPAPARDPATPSPSTNPATPTVPGSVPQTTITPQQPTTCQSINMQQLAAQVAPLVQGQLDFASLAKSIQPHLPPITICTRFATPAEIAAAGKTPATSDMQQIPVPLGGSFTFIKYPQIAAPK